MNRAPVNYSIVGDLYPQEPIVEGGRVIFTIRFMINDADDDNPGDLIKSYFAVGTTITDYNTLGALGVRLKMLEQANKQLIGYVGPLSISKLIEEFDYQIANFDWDRLKGTELWLMDTIGNC